MPPLEYARVRIGICAAIRFHRLRPLSVSVSLFVPRRAQPPQPLRHSHAVHFAGGGPAESLGRRETPRATVCVCVCVRARARPHALLFPGVGPGWLSLHCSHAYLSVSSLSFYCHAHAEPSPGVGPGQHSFTVSCPHTRSKVGALPPGEAAFAFGHHPRPVAGRCAAPQTGVGRPAAGRGLSDDSIFNLDWRPDRHLGGRIEINDSTWIDNFD